MSFISKKDQQKGLLWQLCPQQSLVNRNNGVPADEWGNTLLLIQVQTKIKHRSSCPLIRKHQTCLISYCYTGIEKVKISRRGGNLKKHPSAQQTRLISKSLGKIVFPYLKLTRTHTHTSRCWDTCWKWTMMVVMQWNTKLQQTLLNIIPLMMLSDTRRARLDPNIQIIISLKKCFA